MKTRIDFNQSLELVKTVSGAYINGTYAPHWWEESKDGVEAWSVWGLYFWGRKHPGNRIVFTYIFEYSWEEFEDALDKASFNDELKIENTRKNLRCDNMSLKNKKYSIEKLNMVLKHISHDQKNDPDMANISKIAGIGKLTIDITLLGVANNQKDFTDDEIGSTGEDEGAKKFHEGERKQVWVDIHERNPKAKE
jgi:hypothetical protein